MTVRAARYIVPLATPPAAPFELPFAACSLYLENPSGVWYDVAGFTVPPWTWGLIVRLDVPAASFRVQLLPAAPDALVSEDHGGPLLVIAYADALLPSVGRSLYPPPRAYIRVVYGLIAAESPVRWLIVAGVADRLVVPSSVAACGQVGGPPLRGAVNLRWEFELSTPGMYEPFARQALSPESPSPAPITDLDWLAGVITPNRTITLEIATQPGAGAASVGILLRYYLALP